MSPFINICFKLRQLVGPTIEQAKNCATACFNLIDVKMLYQTLLLYEVKVLLRLIVSLSFSIHEGLEK